MTEPGKVLKWIFSVEFFSPLFLLQTLTCFSRQQAAVHFEFALRRPESKSNCFVRSEHADGLFSPSHVGIYRKAGLKIDCEGLDP